MHDLDAIGYLFFLGALLWLVWLAIKTIRAIPFYRDFAPRPRRRWLYATLEQASFAGVAFGIGGLFFFPPVLVTAALALCVVVCAFGGAVAGLYAVPNDPPPGDWPEGSAGADGPPAKRHGGTDAETYHRGGDRRPWQPWRGRGP